MNNDSLRYVTILLVGDNNDSLKGLEIRRVSG